MLSQRSVPLDRGSPDAEAVAQAESVGELLTFREEMGWTRSVGVRADSWRGLWRAGQRGRRDVRWFSL